ncbi:hypothetical protein R3P38DRAFT_3447427 [Favolaschia claudopus]|uniref:Uncharacterized protein n=1 Tax=Favolaschia claudopus TaxID=2862362 RepID=A0AAW0CVB1_9AGAR
MSHLVCSSFLTYSICIPGDYQPPSDIVFTEENWQCHRNTTFTKNHITCAAGLKPSSTGENHSGGIGEYIHNGQKGSTDEKIQGYEAEYDDMDYGAFIQMVKRRLEKKNSKKPSGSKRCRRLESSDEDEPRHKKEEGEEGPDQEETQGV